MKKATPDDPYRSPLAAGAKPTGQLRFDWFAVIFAIVFPSLVTLVYFQWLKSAAPLFQQTAYGIGKLLQFGFPVVWVWIWHRYKFQRPSNSENKPSDWLIGIGFGAIVIGSMFAIFYGWIDSTETGANVTTMVREKISGLAIDTPLKYLALGVGYALVHTFLEEYYWRWFVFDLLRKQLPNWAANVISSLGFMAHHVILLAFFFGWDHPLTYIVSFCIAIGGSFWAWQFQKTGRLSVPWVSHMIVDAGIFGLGYFLVRDLMV